MTEKKKKKEPNPLGLVTLAGFLGMALINMHDPWFLYKQIADIREIPLWSTPEMNLQSYYSPTKEKPTPVYANGEIVYLIVVEDE